MTVRDIVTSNVDFRSEVLPKELAVVPQAAHLVSTLDMSADDYYVTVPLPPPPQSPSSISSKSPPVPADKPTSGSTTLTESSTSVRKTMTTSSSSSSSSTQSNSRKDSKESRSPSQRSKKQIEIPSPVPTRKGAPQTLRSPIYKAQNVPVSYTTPRTGKSRQSVVEPDTPDIVAMESTAPRTIGESFQGYGQRPHRSAPSKSRLPQPKVHVPRRVKTGHISQATSASEMASTIQTVKTVTPNKAAFNVPSSERVLGIERVMGYTGGPAALLYNGGMIALASGVMIVLVDVRLREAEPQGIQPTKSNPARYSTGLWKAFKSSTVTTGTENYPQAFLKGHSAPVAIIEVSMDGRMMVTCEAGVNAHLVLWDLQEGKRLAVLQPHAESVQSVHFNPESTMLCTSGWDHLRRIQIIIWDIPSVVQASSGNGNISKESSKGVVLARQLSDFHISKIVFSPFEEHSFVSCGRENIRFWRTRKGHLPGRPVQLGEYSRGYMFTDVAYVNAPAISDESGSVNRIMGSKATLTNSASDALRPCVFVASSMGLLLRVDCILEQVVCAYQLHAGPIRAMSINSAYAVTGGDDCKLRIWPLQFTDFLMEAFHEAAVTHVFVSQDARLLTVGTASGTLGILDVFDHRYWTVLRSHVGAVLSVSCRAPVGEEFLTVGRDNTIRLWDSLSGQQKFEFDSPLDAPLCGMYHPSEHVVACGFGSGTLRIFDVETTSTLFERAPQPQHATPLVAVKYSACPSLNNSSAKNHSAMTSYLMLYTVSLEGRLTLYDVKDSYTPLRTLSVSALLDNVRLSGIVLGGQAPTLGRDKDIALFQRRNAAIQLATSQDGRLLAVSCGTLYSLCIFDTNEMVAVFKGSSLFNMPAHETHQTMHSTAGTTTSSMASTLASLPRATDLGHGSTTSPINYLSFEMNEEVLDGSNASNKLFIVTDKRIICIVIASPATTALDSPPAVLGASYGVSITRDDISSRRFDVPVIPVAGAIAHDSASGLFFIAGKRQQEHVHGGALIPPEDDGLSDCLLVVGASMKPTRDSKTHRVRDKISLTCSQVMTDLPGDKCILSIAPCGSASNKIVLTDNSGCVSIWHMREDRIMKLKDQGSPVECDIYTPLENDDSSNRPFGLHDLQDDVADAAGNLDVDFKETVYYSSATEQESKLNESVRSASSVLKESDMDTFFNVMDEDEDVNVVAPELKSTTEFQEGVDVNSAQTSSINDSTTKSSPASSMSGSGILKPSVSSTKSKKSMGGTYTSVTTATRVSIQEESTISSRSSKRQSTSRVSSDSKSKLDQSFGSDSGFVGQQMMEAAFCTEHFSDDESVLDEEAMSGFNFDLGPTVEHALTGNGRTAEGEILLQRIGAPPCFCAYDKTVVTTNGTQISVEHINKGNDINSAHQLLINPLNVSKFADDLDIRQVVRLTSYAPSGLFIAAVVDVFYAPLAHDVGEWKQAPSELHVWSRMSTSCSAGEATEAWQHLGEVTLYTAGADESNSSSQSSKSSLPATVSWTLDESLVLLVAVPIPEPNKRDLTTAGAAASPAQSGVLLSITNWTEKIGVSREDTSLQDEFSSPYMSAPTTPSIAMPGMPLILPFVKKPDGVKVITDWHGPPCDCALTVWGETKIAIYMIDVDCREAITPLWVKDVGRSGPLLAVHISDYSHVFTDCTKKGIGSMNPNDNVVTSTHKAGGRSFSETTIITQAKVMENRADYKLTQSGVQNASRLNKERNQAHSKKSIVKSKTNSNSSFVTGSVPTGTGCQCCDVVYRSYPLLMTLDSVGAISCSRLTFPVDFDQEFGGTSGIIEGLAATSQAQAPASCVAKVSLAHVSGSPRTMAVSPCANILVLASVNCVQIFTVSVKDIPSASFSVSLALRHKVVVPFPLDYISYMPTAEKVAVTVIGGEPASRQNKSVNQVDILCAAKSGSMGIISSKASDNAGKKHAVTKTVTKRDNSMTVVRSSPPFGRVDTVVSLVTDDSTSKIAVLNKNSGEVALLNGKSGKQIVSRLSGIHSSYSMAACDAFLAIGSRCGRVSVYLNNDTMDLGQVVLLNAGGNSAMSTSAKTLKISSDSFSNVTIKDLSIVSSGRSIVALRMDNTLFVIRVALLTKNTSTPGGISPVAVLSQIVTGVRCQVSIPFNLHTSPSAISASECTLMKHEYHFVPCFGDDHLFGCVRGHTIHLYTIYDENAHQPEHHHARSLTRQLSSSSCGMLPSANLRLVRIASYRLVVSAKDIFAPQNVDNLGGDELEDASLRVQARGVHMVRLSGSTLQFTIVGAIEKAQSITHVNTPINFMLTGKVDLGSLSAGNSARSPVVEDVVRLNPCFSLGKVSSVCTTDRDFLGVVGHDGVRLYDICNLHVATRKILAAYKDVDVLEMSGVDSTETGKIFNNPAFATASCRGVFQNTLQCATTISSHTWSRAVITLAKDVDKESEGSSGGAGCMAYVHSTQINSPIMYRIHFT